MILGGLLLLGALGLAGYNLLSEKRAEEASRAAMEEILAIMPEEIAASVPTVNGQQELEIPKHILDPEREMPVINVQGWEYVGVLDIPALDLSLPVMSEWSYAGLYYAPCRFDGSAYNDDLVIIGHNYSCHFGHLKNLPDGSAVYFTDVEGTRFEYVSVLHETLPPNAGEELCSGDWPLSIATCTVGGQARVVLRCERAEFSAEAK